MHRYTSCEKGQKHQCEKTAEVQLRPSGRRAELGLEELRRRPQGVEVQQLLTGRSSCAALRDAGAAPGRLRRRRRRVALLLRRRQLLRWRRRRSRGREERWLRRAQLLLERRKDRRGKVPTEAGGRLPGVLLWRETRPAHAVLQAVSPPAAADEVGDREERRCV